MERNNEFPLGALGLTASDRRRAASVDELQLPTFTESGRSHYRARYEASPTPSRIRRDSADSSEGPRGRVPSEGMVTPGTQQDDMDHAFLGEGSPAPQPRTGGAGEAPGTENRTVMSMIQSMQTTMQFIMEQSAAEREQRRLDREAQELLLRELVDRSAQRPSRRDYEKPPFYNCKVIGEEATSAQVADWIVAIEAGNRLRTGSTAEQHIEWALSKLSPSLQTQWRNHERSLEEPPTWELFLTFIRRQHLDQDAQERDYRRELRRKRQQDGQTPSQFFSEWLAIHQNLGTENLYESKSEAYNFFFGLPGYLQDEMIRQKVPIEKVRHVAQEAERLWSVRDRRGAEASRKDSRKRGATTTEPSPRPPPFQRSQSRDSRKDSKDSPQPRREFTPRPRQASTPTESMKCFYCGKTGHTKAKCFQLQNLKKSDANSTPTGPRQGYPRAKVQAIQAHPKEEVDSSENE
ncbi:hypothetical protein QIS74_03096 [Colletotrichum tabaci]|uniref:CCHC-type domain-containing protein n=1 Tax=Colletotrichum tabaci TaxID=1209068 RepID=A0AAV9TK05_9PEZI